MKMHPVNVSLFLLKFINVKDLLYYLALDLFKEFYQNKLCSDF